MLRTTLLICALLGTTVSSADDHLLLSEVALSPTAGEFIEIYNPTDVAVLLDDYYLSDTSEYVFLPGLTGDGPPPLHGASDFIARLPAGLVIVPGGILVIAIDGAGFLSTFGTLPDAELKGTDPTVPDCVATTPVSAAGLTNGGEMVALFHWDGTTDLVADVDLVNVGNVGPFDTLEDQSGWLVDGPDADTVASAYAQNETMFPGNASISSTDLPAIGASARRVAGELIFEFDGGNGITGDNEISEEVDITWGTSATPSPGIVEFTEVATVIPPGIDLLRARLPGIPVPIAPEFFGPGQFPITSISVSADPLPLESANGFDLGPVNLVLERLAPTELPPVPSLTEVPVRVAAWRGSGTTSIWFDNFTRIEVFDVEVVLSAVPQPITSFLIRHDCPDGGRVSGTIEFLPKVLFRPQLGGPTLSVDLGLEGVDPVSLTFVDGGWSTLPYDSSLGVHGPLPAGVEIDADRNGVVEVLPASGTEFLPAVRVTPCSASDAPMSGVQTLEAWNAGFSFPIAAPVPPAPTPPPTPCAPVEDLSATVDCTSGTVTLTWTESVSYSSLIVYRDNDFVGFNSGGTVIDFPPGPGTYEYRVSASCQDGSQTESALGVSFCQPFRISEFRLGPTAALTDRFIELSGDPGTMVDGSTLVILDDGGVIAAAIDLTGAIPPDGYFLLAEDADTLGATADQIAAFGVGDVTTVSLLIVEGLSVPVGTDLDADDTAVLDWLDFLNPILLGPPWLGMIDRVGTSPSGSGYIDPTLGGDSIDPVFIPHAVRCDDLWGLGTTENTAVIGEIDTPGAPNTCEDCDGDGTSDPVQARQTIPQGDCDGDGVLDLCASTFVDCDGNLLDDACQVLDPEEDCNGNGIVDSCEIDVDPTLDCNENGIPDECDVVLYPILDCDGSGVVDACEIAAGLLEDCNLDDFPDVCQVMDPTLDCDGDGLLDSCEIALDPTLDCDFDGRIDACQILEDPTADCDGDGQIDVCQGTVDPGVDCDSDGFPDGCQVLQDPSLDCDGNGLIDSCEIADDPSRDCDASGTLDSCDIAAAPLLDCDGEGTIDTCQLASDPTLDCDASGGIDFCEIALGFAEDCDGNGTIDSCDIAAGAPDANGDGVPDVCEGTLFLRGDCTVDGVHDIADVVATLEGVFEGGVHGCDDACDANDDGTLDVSDAVAGLLSLFGSAGPLPEPTTACGLDPSTDALECGGFPVCP